MKFNQKFKIIILFLLLFQLYLSMPAVNYNRSNAVNYANEWWKTDMKKLNAVGELIDGEDGLCDHVNIPTYTWYYWINGDRTQGTANNDGDNTIPDGEFISWGADCTNFVSQCLKAGGIEMNGDIGKGGTYIKVRNMGKFLEDKSIENTITSSTNDIPDYVENGDIVIWDHHHCTIVTSGHGSNILLTYHSPKLCDLYLTRSTKYATIP